MKVQRRKVGIRISDRLLREGNLLHIMSKAQRTIYGIMSKGPPSARL